MISYTISMALLTSSIDPGLDRLKAIHLNDLKSYVLP